MNSEGSPDQIAMYPTPEAAVVLQRRAAAEELASKSAGNRRKQSKRLILATVGLVSLALVAARWNGIGRKPGPNSDVSAETIQVQLTSKLRDKQRLPVPDNVDIDQMTFGLIGGIAIARDGSVLVSDLWKDRHEIREIDKLGKTRLVAGLGSQKFNYEAPPATERMVVFPTDVAVSPAGEMYYVTDSFMLPGVWKVMTDGQLERVGWSKVLTRYGRVNPYASITFAEDGQLLVLTTKGLVFSVPGNEQPFKLIDDFKVKQGSEDNWKEVAYSPRGFFAAADGSLYVSDYFRHQVKVRTPDGKIRVVAGSGKGGYSGDGFGARNAKLRNPSGLVGLADGTLLIGDQDGTVLRAVLPNGQIRTLARNLNTSDLAIGNDGTIYAAGGSDVFAVTLPPNWNQ